MDRTAYKNRHIKEHYDRINFVIPKGEKDRIKKICSEIGASVNEYLYMLVCNDLADGTSRMAEKKQGFNAEQERMLEKWQVPRKYYEMIEDLSYTKDEGYFIYLKKGYRNDVTGSRNIHCMKTSEVRRIIGKTRKRWSPRCLRNNIKCPLCTLYASIIEPITDFYSYPFSIKI